MYGIEGVQPTLTLVYECLVLCQSLVEAVRAFRRHVKLPSIAPVFPLESVTIKHGLGGDPPGIRLRLLELLIHLCFLDDLVDVGLAYTDRLVALCQLIDSILLEAGLWLVQVDPVSPLDQTLRFGSLLVVYLHVHVHLLLLIGHLGLVILERVNGGHQMECLCHLVRLGGLLSRVEILLCLHVWSSVVYQVSLTVGKVLVWQLVWLTQFEVIHVRL